MAFYFNLEGVLRFRRCLEDRENLCRQQLLAQYERLRREAEERLLSCAQLHQLLLEELEQGSISAAEAQSRSLQEIDSRQAARKLQSGLPALQEQLRCQTTEYYRARQRREILQSLKDSQRSEYSKRQERSQQAKLDESFLLRRIRSSA